MKVWAFLVQIYHLKTIACTNSRFFSNEGRQKYYLSVVDCMVSIGKDMTEYSLPLPNGSYIMGDCVAIKQLFMA